MKAHPNHVFAFMMLLLLLLQLSRMSVFFTNVATATASLRWFGEMIRSSLPILSKAGPPFTECMLRLEKEGMNQHQMDEWDAKMVLLPYLVKVFDRKFFVLFYLANDS